MFKRPEPFLWFYGSALAALQLVVRQRNESVRRVAHHLTKAHVPGVRTKEICTGASAPPRRSPGARYSIYTHICIYIYIYIYIYLLIYYFVLVTLFEHMLPSSTLEVREYKKTSLVFNHVPSDRKIENMLRGSPRQRRGACSAITSSVDLVPRR